MLIPQHWAEARQIGKTRDGRQVTVRRFGWSDASVADAERVAAERARDALARILEGQSLIRRERKVPYNGADDLPIREEILERAGDCIVTRNSYGAHCLNVPNVLFVDVDNIVDPPIAASCSFMILLTLAAAAVSWFLVESIWLTLLVAALAFIISYPLLTSILKILRSETGDFDRQMRNRLTDFLTTRPDWHLRLYRTPAGHRVMALHRTFDPDDPEVRACFHALGADPMYVRMCQLQKCFRARLTAKPWRMGESAMPVRGVWPVDAERMARRTTWADAYDTNAEDYAACQYVEDYGSALTDPQVEAVRKLHDDRSRALRDLPLA